VGLIAFVICCHGGEGDTDAVEGLGEIFQVLGRGRGGLARSAVMQALVVITALVMIPPRHQPDTTSRIDRHLLPFRDASHTAKRTN
jgi:hypothetical protein